MRILPLPIIFTTIYRLHNRIQNCISVCVCALCVFVSIVYAVAVNIML